MTEFGYTLLCEQAPPRQLVRDAARAEEAGFDFAAISDHYFPWLEAMGHSPYTWSVLGALAQATERMPLMTMVTCPIVRYHPAVVAQKAATVAQLTGGRFSLGLGAGEQLNEHVVGQDWPPVDTRHEMLEEAIELIRDLWSGEYVTYHGKHFTVNSAKLYDPPEGSLPIGVAVSGPQACRLAGHRGDAVIAIEPNSALVDGFVEAGGAGKPRYGQVPISYDTDPGRARSRAWELFRWGVGGWKVMSELPGPVNFDAYSSVASEDQVAQLVSCGPDVETHVQAIRQFVDAGFDHIALVGVGGDRQEEFLRYAREELLPALRAKFPS